MKNIEIKKLDYLEAKDNMNIILDLYLKAFPKELDRIDNVRERILDSLKDNNSALLLVMRIKLSHFYQKIMIGTIKA